MGGSRNANEHVGLMQQTRNTHTYSTHTKHPHVAFKSINLDGYLRPCHFYYYVHTHTHTLATRFAIVRQKYGNSMKIIVSDYGNGLLDAPHVQYIARRQLSSNNQRRGRTEKSKCDTNIQWF